jgi:hypothetical protein
MSTEPLGTPSDHPLAGQQQPTDPTTPAARQARVDRLDDREQLPPPPVSIAVPVVVTTVPAVGEKQPVEVPDAVVTPPGLSIADALADDTVDAMLTASEDPLLRHEKVWTRAAVRACMQMTAYHADRRSVGEGGPEVAPLSLVMALTDAVEHIRSRRLAEVDTGPRAAAQGADHEPDRDG